MNILISVNYKYLDKAKTMLYSLSLNCQEKLTVYLLNKELKQPAVNRFIKFLRKKCNAELICLDVNHLPLTEMPFGHFSIETYFRILAQRVLPDTVERILWLDADIVILKNIKDFYYQDFEDKYLVVTQDIKNNDEIIINVKKNLGLPSDYSYFNAGVLLMNMKKIRESVSENEILETCEKLKDRLIYFDQDILNIIYKDRVKYTDNFFYNYQLFEGEKFDNDEMKNVAVLHYTGLEKPWNYKTVNEFSKYYWNIQLKRHKYFSFSKCMLLHKIRDTMIKLYQKYLLKIH